MPRIFRQWWAGPCVFLAALGASFWLTRSAAYIRAEDRDHDGRPDVWRVFDRQGNLTRVAVDTNADGRSDVQEYYEHGALVRREYDRDFDDRVDLIQEFDAATADSVRSVEDVDFDGTADVLLLYSHGQPIFAKWAHVPAHAAQAGPSRAASDELAAFDDPFRGDLAIRGLHTEGTSDCIELTASTGLPAQPALVVDTIAESAIPVVPNSPHVRSVWLTQSSPRAPPTSYLFN